MKTDNEKIAEFMGGKWETVWVGGVESKAFHFPGWHITDWPHVIHEDTFNYHTSWDWLMPVVEKIETIISKPGASKTPGWHTQNEVFDGRVATDINVAYSCVVQFIDWYNNTSQTLKK